MKVKELKTLLRENKIHFYTYWDKKKLIASVNTKFYQRQSLKRKKVRMLIMID